jgi:hypothetical protein
LSATHLAWGSPKQGKGASITGANHLWRRERTPKRKVAMASMKIATPSPGLQSYFIDHNVNAGDPCQGKARKKELALVCRGKCNRGLLLCREMHTLDRDEREGEAQRSTGRKSEKANL